jgi:hypothetical protein
VLASLFAFRFDSEFGVLAFPVRRSAAPEFAIPRFASIARGRACPAAAELRTTNGEPGIEGEPEPSTGNREA